MASAARRLLGIDETIFMDQSLVLQSSNEVTFLNGLACCKMDYFELCS
jgi:hypothetical protein